MSEACMEIRDSKHLEWLLEEDDFDVVLLDEAHFFDDLFEIYLLLQKHEIDFVFAALNLTFKSKPWPSVLSVLPFCNKHKCMNAVCQNCGDKRALFSFLMGEKMDDSQPQIGGSERYRSLCRRCFSAVEA